MVNTIQNARIGQRKALGKLYENNKNEAYYLALCLLGDEGLSAEAVSTVFKNLRNDVNLAYVKDEEEFKTFFMRKVAIFCKNTITKKEKKAFQTPKDRYFYIQTEKMEMGEHPESYFSLPPLQRFLFVLDALGYSDLKFISAVFDFDEKTSKIGLDANEGNVNRFFARFGISGNYETKKAEILGGKHCAKAPKELDDNVYQIIDQISTPIEREQNKKKLTIFLIVIILCAVLGGLVGIAIMFPEDTTTEIGSDEVLEEDDEGEDEETDSSVVTEPIIELDEEATYYADIVIEDYGTITVKLDQNVAPITVANFVNLANEGFYDGKTFHRIMEGFMMQGGAMYTDGTDDDEYTIFGEFYDNGYTNAISHTRGTISMARSAYSYDSASTQFFIMHEDETSLDGQYAAFGTVTEGMDIVDLICESANPTDDNGTIPEEEQPVISTVTIRIE